jgi:hypothetical protein
VIFLTIATCFEGRDERSVFPNAHGAAVLRSDQALVAWCGCLRDPGGPLVPAPLDERADVGLAVRAGQLGRSTSPRLDGRSGVDASARPARAGSIGSRTALAAGTSRAADSSAARPAVTLRCLVATSESEQEHDRKGRGSEAKRHL